MSSFCAYCCFRPNVPIRCYCCDVVAERRWPTKRTTLCHLYFHCCCCGDDGDDVRDRLVPHPNRLPIRWLHNIRPPSSCSGRNCCRPCRPLRPHRFCCRHPRSCRLFSIAKFFFINQKRLNDLGGVAKVCLFQFHISKVSIERPRTRKGDVKDKPQQQTLFLLFLKPGREEQGFRRRALEGLLLSTACNSPPLDVFQDLYTIESRPIYSVVLVGLVRIKLLRPLSRWLFDL